MSDRVTLDRTSDGRLVAIKRSRGGSDDERLRHEARLLERAGHPGVVELVDLAEGERGLELRTLAIGDGSLAVRRHLPVPRVAALATALAATLADLHALGIVHGRIEASHVLLGPQGRPLLTGFAEASLLDEEPQHTTAEDVGGLGRLVLDLLPPEVEAEPIPDLRRRLRRRGRPRWTGYQQRALLTLADQACADEPTHRPTARAFAAALSAAFPDPPTDEVDDADAVGAPGDGAVPGSSTGLAPEGARAHGERERQGAGSTSSRGEGGTRPRPALVASGAAAVGVLGLAALGLGASTIRADEQPQVLAQPADVEPPSAGDDGAAATDRPTETTSADRSPPTSGPSTTSPGSTSTTAPSCPAPDGAVADLDGDGCFEVLVVEDTIVTTDAGRFEVGEEGDEVVVGDWDCDGASTPALLRPSTGDVFAFERWAPADGEVSAEAIDQVPGGTHLTVERTDGCDQLVVVGPDGPTSVEVDGER